MRNDWSLFTNSKILFHFKIIIVLVINENNGLTLNENSTVHRYQRNMERNVINVFFCVCVCDQSVIKVMVCLQNIHKM